MEKRRIIKDDGRYLIYYSFKEKSTCKSCNKEDQSNKEEKSSV